MVFDIESFFAGAIITGFSLFMSGVTDLVRYLLDWFRESRKAKKERFNDE